MEWKGHGIDVVVVAVGEGQKVIGIGHVSGLGRSSHG